MKNKGEGEKDNVFLVHCQPVFQSNRSRGCVVDGALSSLFFYLESLAYLQGLLSVLVHISLVHSTNKTCVQILRNTVQ